MQVAPTPVIPGVLLPLKVLPPTTLGPPPPTTAPPLLFAAAAGSVATMKALVDAGAKPDLVAADGTTLTLAAAGGGSLEALKYAVSLDPNVNAANKQGQTAFHMVVANRLGADNVTILHYLVDQGCKLEVKDEHGVTPGLFVNRAGPQALRVAYIQILSDHGIVSGFH